MKTLLIINILLILSSSVYAGDNSYIEQINQSKDTSFIHQIKLVIIAPKIGERCLQSIKLKHPKMKKDCDNFIEMANNVINMDKSPLSRTDELFQRTMNTTTANAYFKEFAKIKRQLKEILKNYK